MRLRAVTVQKFKNIVDPQRIEIEDDVTGLVGKNEAGKTTVLKAMHRLNPANGSGHKFDVTTEYPRWRLARDRRQDELDDLKPIVAELELEEEDVAEVAEHLPASPPAGTICFAARTYDNRLQISLRCDLTDVIRAAAAAASVADGDLPELLECESINAVKSRAKELSKEVKETSALRAKALTAFGAAVVGLDYLNGVTSISQEASNALAARMPKFFYFSSYSILPGEANLTKLAAKVEAQTSGSR